MSELVLTESDAGSSHEVERDARIEVRLAENPTTGYLWNPVQEEGGALELVGSELLLPDKPLVGGGGTRVLTFRARESGEARLRLECRREWEPAGSEIGEFEIDLVVKG